MNIDTTDIFKKSFRKLLKKDRKLINEYEQLLDDLETNPSLGTDLGNGRYKIRLKNNEESVSTHKIDEIISNYKSQSL
ncbi:MAG: hypothetical protein Q9M34_09340 [Sulfurimonas sp.]|nr:hypothetical protein [Sulfurimonas sp.]